MFPKILLLFHRQGNCIPFAASDGMILVFGPLLEGHSVIFLAIQTHRGSSRMRLCLIRLALKAPNIALLQDAKALLDMLA